jgi:hypothetical protein
LKCRAASSAYRPESGRVDINHDLAAWGLHSHDIIIDGFPLEQIAQAYDLMAGGRSREAVIEYAG